MRVAMGLALNEIDREARAIEFYEVLSTFDFMSSTPTLFNAGTLRSQLSSCYLTTVADDLDGIYEAIKENALLSKFAGGLGNDWTQRARARRYIKGTNGKSQGVVPFLKVVNDTAVAVNQGGKRKGAVCAYLETWHLDIEEFLELRKNTGDDRRRTHDMNTANWVPDLFMKRVMEGGDVDAVLAHRRCPDLHDKFGRAFEERLRRATKSKAARGEIKLFKTGPARRPVAQDADDAVRDRPSVDHVQGRLQRALAAAARRRRALDQPVHRDHAQHAADRDRGLQPRLGQPRAAHRRDGASSTTTSSQQTVATAMRMLDNVIDINYYARHEGARLEPAPPPGRPRHHGLPGRAVRARGRRTRRSEAVEFADRSMEAICYYAYWASTELAAGARPLLELRGSLWDRGILPIDTLELLDSASAARRCSTVDRRPRRSTGTRCARAIARTACATRTASRSRRPRRSRTSSASAQSHRADVPATST